MVLGAALRLLLTAVTGTSVIVPVSYLASNGTFESLWGLMAYKNGNNCKHIPLKMGERENKLLVCVSKEGTKPVFKWRTKDTTQEIETLTWKRKDGVSGDSQNENFELEIKLNGQTNGLIKEEGQEGFYLPSIEFKKMETICHLGSGKTRSAISLICPDPSSDKKEHSIDTIDIY
ncbi:hypothetical protein WEN_02350 [Mycoplasma wenyonii str. Massachusetts]|uniref:Uncharacterized protein n=1 Tax=Mycoplasma wenyonii (strain Massachusetts) TaxID=1197325 RepID=I6ZF90_MYCWM|nr:hypothetical protein [Mycoplasma wenyonii]AFN65257.1 hypothetical protein WEN_02350 [Mycoplasma wenyonii str. Massachusetts]